jgi:hypothetical protein
MRAGIQAASVEAKTVAPYCSALVRRNGGRLGFVRLALPFTTCFIKGFIRMNNRGQKRKSWPCDKCLENQWAYSFDAGIVTATCKACGAESSWSPPGVHRRAIRRMALTRLASGPFLWLIVTCPEACRWIGPTNCRGSLEDFSLQSP